MFDYYGAGLRDDQEGPCRRIERSDAEVIWDDPIQWEPAEGLGL